MLFLTHSHRLISFLRAWAQYGMRISLLMLTLYGDVVWADCRQVVAWKHKPPYLMMGADKQVHGLHADLIREAMRRMNCSVTFIEMPWARAMLELQNGKVTMVPGAGVTPERSKFAYFSKPTNRARNVLFISRAALQTYHITRLADIEGTSFRMGVTINARYGGDYDTLVDTPAFAARLVPFTDRDIGWKMILADRSDGLIADELTGAMELRDLKYSDSIFQSGLTISSEYDLIAISKAANNASFVEKINSALDNMIADGTYKRLLQQNSACKVSVIKLDCD